MFVGTLFTKPNILKMFENLDNIGRIPVNDQFSFEECFKILSHIVCCVYWVRNILQKNQIKPDRRFNTPLSYFDLKHIQTS